MGRKLNGAGVGGMVEKVSGTVMEEDQVQKYFYFREFISFPPLNLIHGGLQQN